MRCAGPISCTVSCWDCCRSKDARVNKLRASVVLTLVMAALLTFSTPLSAAGTRLKELASIQGVRDNQLFGYGLVVGLNGTGDKPQTIFSIQTLTNLLRRMGVSVNPSTILVRNMAAVMVTATLPPFAQPGTRIDVTAAAIGDATNLQGGMLVFTPLKGADGQVYATAQGNLLTGGFVAGRGGNSQTVNHPTVGRIPEGAIVEQSPPSVPPGPKIKLELHQADFTTAARVVDALNKHFGQDGAPVARADNAALVEIDLPPAFKSRPVEFIAAMENVTVEDDHAEKIVINEKTGTIVLGKDVKISPVAILQGSLSVEVRTTFDVSQPDAFSSGKTTVTPEVNVNATEQKAQNVVLQKGATVEQLVRALQAIGSTPRDIIAVLQGMRSAGALDAEIVVN
jgi:flagellar P-ring protein precursor FlgI